MSTTDVRPTHPAVNTAGPTRGDTSPTGPIARIVAGSVLLGLVGALLLLLQPATAAPMPPSTEISFWNTWSVTEGRWFRSRSSWRVKLKYASV